MDMFSIVIQVNIIVCDSVESLYWLDSMFSWTIPGPVLEISSERGAMY